MTARWAFAPGHTPLIGRLGFGGRSAVGHGDSETAGLLYIEGGFVEVIDDVISVLTERALPPEKIDERKARDEIAAAAARRATTPELMELRDREAAQGRAQLHVAQHGQ